MNVIRNRLALVRITPECLVDLVKPGRKSFIVDSDMPDDARVHDCYLDRGNGEFVVVVSSSHLDEAQPYEPIPEITAVLKSD